MQTGAASASDEAKGCVLIDVCVCTYRRSLPLHRLLESLAAQKDAPPFRVLIADNQDEPVEAEQVAELARLLPLRIKYIHAPSGNIALARNACLDHAHAPLIAFIDDDEIAEVDWLAQLYRSLQSLDVVFGPVQAQYATDTPEWMRRGDFHSKVPVLRRDGRCDTGYTANVLLRRECVGARRFLLALGKSGGEDTMFFALLHRDGARLGYCATARVIEPVEPTRANFRWLCRRAFASGQAHARTQLALRQHRARLVPLAAVKFLCCAVASLVCLWSPVHWRRQWLRGRLHLGVIATALGAVDIEIYRGNNASGV